MSHIRNAVEPLRADAVEAAGKFAAEYASRVLEALRAVGMDLNVYAPMAHGRMSRTEYLAAMQKRGMAERLTTYTQATRRPSEPNIRAEAPEAVARFIQEARDDANAEFDAYVLKLEQKIGAHTAASLEGSHVWGYSVLTVQTPTGEQKWKTQQILNVSKLGKVFNQWPTRLMK